MPKRTATNLEYTECPVAFGNFDNQRSNIDLIVIHTEVGSRDGTRATFNTPPEKRASKKPSSAHYAVNLDGTLDHFLEEYLNAFHAGNYEVNKRSIGLEHEDHAEPNAPRPDALYLTSSKLVADICKFYGFPADKDHIQPHHNFIETGCPGTLDVDRIIKQAQLILNPPAPQGVPANLLTQDEVNSLKVVRESWTAWNKEHPDKIFQQLEAFVREFTSIYPHYQDLLKYQENARLIKNQVIDELTKI